VKNDPRGRAILLASNRTFIACQIPWRMMRKETPGGKFS